MRPKVKYAIIYRHRNEYPVSVMCKFFGVSRSGYYDFIKRLGQPEHDADLADRIQECQNKTDKTYGYRRVWKWLKDRNIKIYTAQLQDSEWYYDTDMRGGTAIVMGTEATGLTDCWRKAADAHIKIPMLGKLGCSPLALQRRDAAE